MIFVLPNHIIGSAVMEWIAQWEAIGPYLVKYGTPDRYEIGSGTTLIEWMNAP